MASPPITGILSIQYNKSPLDFCVVDRGSRVTMIAFHSALTSRQKTVPVFSALATAAEAGFNIISVADPSISLGVDLAWYLGSRGQGPIRPSISRIVSKLLAELGTERTILFGSSGGGYAAAYYAPDFPGSVALILNPRLDLSALPRSTMAAYLGTCHKTQKVSPKRIRLDFVPERVADTYSGTMKHYVAIIQNKGDLVFRRHQTKPFVEELAHTQRVYVQYGEWGHGHLPIPKHVVSGAVSLLGDLRAPLPVILEGSVFRRGEAGAPVQ